LKASAKVIEIFNGCGIDFVRPIVNFNRL